jgi:uncharacterized ferritin-like protein (DUF455 family)
VINPLELCRVDRKLANLDLAIERALAAPSTFVVPPQPGRDIEVVPIKNMPFKTGLSRPVGQARLMHDLASIELQALELGFRTLVEYPDAPAMFREQLAEIVRDEARHLSLCLSALDHLGYKFGAFPVHVALWQSVAVEDSLLDRILVVHRYLEGSGLDAGETLRIKLSGVAAGLVREVVSVISHEEVAHVKFGSDWYRAICKIEGVDPETDFSVRLDGLLHRIPRRMERLARGLRLAAGFSEAEMSVLDDVRERFMSGDRPIHKK